MVERQLPAGWWKTVDQSSGKPYYYKADGTRQWHFPGDPEPDDGDGDVENFENLNRGGKDISGRSSNQEGISQSDVEISIVGAIFRFLLFPFTSVVNFLIWGGIQLIFIILEVVVGFVSLWIGGVGFLKIEKDVKVSFVVVYLIVDGFVWLGELILHYALLKPGAADYLLNHPPTFSTSFTRLIPENQATSHILFYIRVVTFVIFRVFQLVWTAIAYFKLSLEYLTAVDSDNHDLTTLAHTSNLDRLIGLAYVVLNFVSVVLWICGFIFLFLLHAYGSESLSPTPRNSMGTDNANTNSSSALTMESSPS